MIYLYQDIDYVFTVKVPSVQIYKLTEYTSIWEIV